jgi:tetratricopeptide (TPR) repeat protein
MNLRIPSFLLVVLGAGFPAPAFAWGPVTEQAIVTTAVRVISKEGIVQLSKLERDVREGAGVSPEVMLKLYPDFAAGPVRTVESEMYLLDAVRGDVIDPYFAYRLGVLGRLVAQISSPLLNDNPTYRDRYYADVEDQIQQVNLKPSARAQVDPVVYFERVQRLANARRDMIIKDYQDGLGFTGLAKAALPEDASRSLDAVLDVWYTILTRNVAHANISDSQLREYVISALGFYIKRHNENEIDLTYRRLEPLTTKTPNMAKRIGDMFYDGEFYERAIKEYQDVLAAEPRRKDVVEKIAAYYVKAGEDALAAKRLEQAHEAYAKAAQTDPLHPLAEAKRLEVERLIAERDARHEAVSRYIEEAAGLQTQAEQLTMQRKFSEAMTALKEAQKAYEKVADEFPMERQAAAMGMANIASRLRELKGEMVQNAQSLSGAGFNLDARRLAVTSAKNLDEQALRSLLNARLDAELDTLKTEMQAVIGTR